MTPQEKAKEVIKYLISKGAKLVNKKGSILMPMNKQKQYWERYGEYRRKHDEALKGSIKNK